MPTSNLILLAQEGYRYLRRLPNGLYVGKPNKIGATHRLTSTRPHPRYEKKEKTPPGHVRIIYADPKNFLDFPNTLEGRAAANEKLAAWRELAKNAAPTSAVAVPRGRAYKNFVHQRTEAAKQGSLYDKQRVRTTMSKKTAPKASTTRGSGDSKNGVTRPGAGTTTGKVWDIADKLGADRQAVIKEATKRGVNLATIMTQYGKWRKYNGMEGRTAKKAVKKPTPPKKAAKKPAPPAPATEATE